MRAWYWRKGNSEEMLYVHHNFYIYTAGLNVFFSYDPAELEEIDTMIRNTTFETQRLEDCIGHFEVLEVADSQITAFQDLCFNNADRMVVFNSMMQIFHTLVTQVDYAPRDLKEGDKKWESNMN